MIKVLIIEDEIPARKKLIRFLEELATKSEVVAEIDTVERSIEFLNNHKVDVIFSDIELLDGRAFEIYSQVSVSCPIIFTTAYDQFLMDAFESNGIAYLLKPFSKDKFRIAWDKFLLFRKTAVDENKQLNKLTELIEQSFARKEYKKRFAIPTHHGIHFLDTHEITLFKANEGVVFAYDTLGKKHLLSESTLKEIEQQLNPLDFFRINRSELVSKQYIQKIERYTKNTLAINIKAGKNHVITSQSTTASFREWIEK